MDKLHRALPGLLLSCALAGCQTGVSPYVAPQEGATAKLIFRAKTPPGFGYALYAFDDPHACAKPLLIGSGNSKKSVAPTWVRPGPLATLRYVAVDQSRRFCRVTLSFYPQGGKTYALFTEQDQSSCVLRLVDATDGEKLKPVPTYQRRLQPGTVQCTALPQAALPDGSARSTSGETSPAESPSTRGLDDLKGLLPPE
ncbi:MAG TPA: hypothetical protein VE008_01850 [Burkholderiales bacterium]|nr:hypothetical protein [Burkholderiales bacterium]